MFEDYGKYGIESVCKPQTLNTQNIEGSAFYSEADCHALSGKVSPLLRGKMAEPGGRHSQTPEKLGKFIMSCCVLSYITTQH